MPMQDFYSSFVETSSNIQRLRAQQENRQYAEDANRRANAEAQRKSDAEARQQQLTARLSEVAGYEPAPGATLGGTGETETDHLNGMLYQSNKMLRYADIAHDMGNYDLANQFRDDARAFGAAELDQRIKTNQAIAGEADNKAGIIQSIGDQASFENALFQLQRNGFGKEAAFLVKISGGEYTPQIQPVLDSFVKASMTGKEAVDTDRAILKDARQYQNQQNMQHYRELTAIRGNESLALRREKQATAERPKATTDAEYRQQYKIEKKEFEENYDIQDRITNLREKRDEDKDITLPELRELTRMEAKEAELRNLPTFLARRKKKAEKEAAPFEANPELVPGANAGVTKADVLKMLKSRGLTPR